MNICYCFDKNYLKMALDSAKSVKKYNKNCVFYFFTNDDIDESKLTELGQVQIIRYNKELLAEFDNKLCGYKHVSKTCFVRFLIPKYLEKEARALYLDCDTICKGDLSEYYNAEFDNNYIIGCQGIDYSKIQAKELKIAFYINSGVLLFNIPLMNQENYLDQIKKTWRGCLGLPRVFSADETIINYVFHKKIKLISEKYNYCYNRPYTGREIPKDLVKIWHVTGANKEFLNNVR